MELGKSTSEKFKKKKNFFSLKINFFYLNRSFNNILGKTPLLPCMEFFLTFRTLIHVV